MGIWGWGRRRAKSERSWSLERLLGPPQNQLVLQKCNQPPPEAACLSGWQSVPIELGPCQNSGHFVTREESLCKPHPEAWILETTWPSNRFFLVSCAQHLGSDSNWPHQQDRGQSPGLSPLGISKVGMNLLSGSGPGGVLCLLRGHLLHLCNASGYLSGLSSILKQFSEQLGPDWPR